MNYSNHPVTKEFRQQLRREETPTERMLWKYLRRKQLDGYRFRQQHGFGPYILDFYCPELRLCIELDGGVHDSVEQKEKDEDRTIFLNQNKIKVMRFRNEEVEENVENVLKRIREYINEIRLFRPPSPSRGSAKNLGGTDAFCSDPQPPRSALPLCSAKNLGGRMSSAVCSDPQPPNLGGSWYIETHIDREPEYLYRLWRATNIHLLHGRMASGHLQGRLLKMLVQMIRPKNILEVGTFSGYSAICMAEGLEEGGMVYTFEINDEQEDFTRPWIEGSAVADKIRFIIGDAITEAPRLGIEFDMAFIDGNKRTYVETYEAVLPILRPGGFILADNTLWDGHVTDPAYAHDQQTQGIVRFNDYIAHDTRVEKVILPLRDGLTIIRKKET